MQKTQHCDGKCNLLPRVKAECQQDIVDILGWPQFGNTAEEQDTVVEHRVHVGDQDNR